MLSILEELDWLAKLLEAKHAVFVPGPGALIIVLGIIKNLEESTENKLTIFPGKENCY